MIKRATVFVFVGDLNRNIEEEDLVEVAHTEE